MTNIDALYTLALAACDAGIADLQLGLDGEYEADGFEVRVGSRPTDVVADCDRIEDTIAIAAGHNIGLPGLVALRGQLKWLWNDHNSNFQPTYGLDQILAICRALAEGHGPAIDALRDALGGCGGAG